MDPRQYALSELAEKLTLTPDKMVEEDWKPLRDLGFDDRACLEVAHIICLFNYFTRLAGGFGLQPDAKVLEAGKTGIPLKPVK